MMNMRQECPQKFLLKEKQSYAYCSTLLMTSFDNVVLAAVGQQVEQFVHQSQGWRFNPQLHLTTYP